MSFCHNKKYEREYANLMIERGYHCERVAGSGSGKNAVCDCILFRDGKVFLVEVKATKEKKFYYRKPVREQLERMKEVAMRHGAIPLLVIKFKNRGWEEVILNRSSS